MKSDMEDRKWLDDYKALKQVAQNNPFTVPDGYFEEMGKQLTSYINLDKANAGEGFIVPENFFDAQKGDIDSRINIEMEASGFDVPANYFDELSSNIQSRVNIELETTGFAVPENYFDELSSNIESRVALEMETSGFEVPANYFNELQEQISARLAVEEVLDETDHSFAVPEGYFEQLNRNILSKTVNQDTVEKVIGRRSIVRRMYASGAFKYAAAACFALLVGTGVYIRQITDPVYVHDNSLLHKEISTLPVSDIQKYLDNDEDANDTQHTVIVQGDHVNDTNLKNDLQDLTDSN